VAGDFEKRLCIVNFTVQCCDHRMYIPWAGPKREDGSGFLVMVHRPAHFSRVFFCVRRMSRIFHTRMTAFVTGAPPLAPRTGTCRLIFAVVKLSRAWVNVGCGVRGLVGTVEIEACRVCFAVSTIPKITILPTHTLVKTVARRIRRKREWCRQCNLFPRAAHLPAVKQQGSRPATDEHELEHEDSRPPQLYTSLQPWTTNGESKITCLVC
jgi:hypothetical protein